MRTSHAPYYDALRQRCLADDRTLTLADREEWRLHLLICPECCYRRAESIMDRSPEEGMVLMREMEGALSLKAVKPYLRELAWTLQAAGPLDGWQEMIWRYVQRDAEALGWLRVWQAEALWRSRPGDGLAPQRRSAS